MDSESLAKRILTYAEDRFLLLEHGDQAASFAAKFSPERYRRQVQSLLKNILGYYDDRV